MGLSTITSSGIIQNETPMNGAVNPWECHTFKYTTQYTEDNVTHVKWYITDIPPNNIVIDKDTGIITGIIQPLIKDMQPLLVDNDFYPIEKLKEDGSNYNSIGRIKQPYKDYYFNINRDYLDNDDTDSNGDPKQKTTTSTVYIRVVKNHDIDNFVFGNAYLDAGWTLKIKSKKYTKVNKDEWFKDHPGPFSTCVN